jgi:hypothetical protein
MAGTVIIFLVTGVIYLIVRDHCREKRAWDAYLAAVREDAINEAAWHEPTPMFDRTIEEHPWVAEQLLAHDLSDDDAVARWLA